MNMQGIEKYIHIIIKEESMCCRTTSRHHHMCRPQVHESICQMTGQKSFGLRFSCERKKGEMLTEYLEELKSEAAYVEKLIADLEE